jgi:hypothetical protein
LKIPSVERDLVELVLDGEWRMAMNHSCAPREVWPENNNAAIYLD